MRFCRCALLRLAVLLLAGNVLAQPAFDPAGRAKVVEPYLGADTLVVVHVDVAGLDFAKIEKWVMDVVSPGMPDAGAVEEFKKGLHGSLDETSGMLGAFRKAGGRDVYLLMTVSELDSEALRVVPLAAGADVDALTKLLAPPPAPGAPAGPREDLTVAVKSGDVLLAGTQAQLDRATQNKAASVARPELAKAFEAAGDSTTQFLILPTDGARQLVEQNLPQLPTEVGGGPPTVVTRGVSWAALAMTQPPQMRAALVIQSPTPEAAKALNDLVTKGLQSVAALPDAKKKVPDLDQVLANLTPVLAGDRLSIALDDRKLADLLRRLITSALKGRETAKSLQSMSNEKSLLQTGLLYANDHNGEWPADLAALVKAGGLPESAQTNPFAAAGEAGYVYVRPVKNAGGGVVVIYETRHAPADKIIVGFADGHVDTISAEELRKKLKAAK